MNEKFLLPQGRITSKYGYRKHPITGKRTFHNGIDLAMPVGTRINAPCEGEVIKVWENATGGLQMQVRCGDYTFGFAHLSKIFIKSGNVCQGDLLALSGNTGATTGAHLHMTVRKEGKLIDPEILYKK